MAWFPIFINLKGRKILVVGGGKVATRKVKALLPFEPEITVVAPEVTDLMCLWEKEGQIELKLRLFSPSDLSGKELAIVAVDDREVARKIGDLSREKGIWTNSAAGRDQCSFLFPALIQRGDLTVGIATSGKAPSLSSLLREKWEAELPPSTVGLVEKIDHYRSRLSSREKRRKKIRDFTRKEWKEINGKN